MTIHRYEDSGMESLRAYHLGLSGSEYYGPSEEAHRAGRLVQRSLVLEREQLQALAALEAEVAKQGPTLMQRAERQFRRLIGLSVPAAEGPSANRRSRRIERFAA